MQDMKAVLDVVISMFNIPVTFGNFTFTFLQSFIALCVLGIVVNFVRSVFGGD